MVKQRRGVAVLFAILVLFAISTSLFFLLHEAEHDCEGEGCPICAAITVCLDILNRLTKVFVIAAAALAFVKGILFPSFAFCRFPCKTTPVSLNVKLLN